MAFASSAFGQLRYIAEATPGVTPGAGNGTNLRMTSPTLKASPKTVTSQEISSTRMARGNTLVDMDLDGGFNIELSAQEYDPFLESILMQPFVHYGTNGLGTPFSMTSTATTITAGAAPAGANALTNIGLAQWFKVVPPAAATAQVKAYFRNRWFKSHSVTASTTTVITLDPSTPIAAPGILAAAADYAITSSQASNGSSLVRTFTLEHALTDINQFLPFRGMRTNTMDLSFSVGSIITGSFGFMGQGHDGMVAATTLPGSPVQSKGYEVMNSVADLGHLFEGGVSILSGTSSFIISADIQINQGLRGQKALGVFGNAGVGYGDFAVSGTLEMYVENATYYNRWLKGENTTLSLGVVDGGGNGYLIELDKVKFKDGGLNPGGKSEDVKLSLPFEAFYLNGVNRGIRITRAVGV